MLKRLKVSRIFVISVFIVVMMTASLIRVQSVKAEDPALFSEHFDGAAIDTSKWQVQEQNVNLSGNPAWGGNITVANSILYMSSKGSAFPFLQTVDNPFPASGNFVLQFSLQYTTIADWGDGLMVGNGTPTLDSTNMGDHVWHNKIFDVWAADKGTVIDPITGQFTSNETNIYIELLNSTVYEEDYAGFKPSSPEQTYELTYINGVYLVYVNGIQVAQAPSDLRPTTIIIGEPPIFDLPESPENVATWGSWWGWSSFQMDYINIQPTDNNSTTTPNRSTIQATTNNGSTVNLNIEGNITSSQISNITITTSQSDDSTTICFELRGESGTTGFGNITIPKSAVPYGIVPTIFIDNQTVQNQGYTQDDNNYYVWYAVHFSTHQVSIQFTAPNVSPTPTQSLSTSSNGTLYSYSMQEIIYGIAISVIILGIIMTALLLLINGRKGKILSGI